MDLNGLLLLPPSLPNDDLRWWNLTDTLSDNDTRGAVQRLDRLNVGYTGDKAVLRFGRQAVSWGNGLIYNPVDFFNPFNPTAVDTEYKLGEDMLYGQYLLDDGSDWQAVVVQRRDEYGSANSEQRTTALKFHGFGRRRSTTCCWRKTSTNLSPASAVSATWARRCCGATSPLPTPATAG